jgi:uncharacterized protein (UPF0333 family)
MFLNIILTLLVIVLLSITLMIYFWWKKFGKSFFDMAKNLTNMNKTMFNPKNMGNMGNMGDINQQMKIIQDFFKKKQ